MRRVSAHIFPGLATLAFATAASAGTAYVCHPDPAGTRTLRVAGAVTSYDMHGKRVVLLYRRGRGCHRVTWDVFGGRSAVRASCRASDGPSVEARSGATSISLRTGSADTPDRLVVSGRGASRSWPLPERAFHVDVDGTTAIFATARSRDGGVYALDLRTGRAAIVGLTRRQDTPRIERAGLVFRDNLEKARKDDGTTLMKFVPRRYVQRALRTVGKPLRVDGRITDLAMDGSRVALGVRKWHRGCDAVLFWNITWRYSIPITEEDERTCAWSRRGASIGSVSIAGLRAAWTMRTGTEQRLLSASSIDCFERVVVTARLSEGQRVLGHAGDGGLLAYAVERPGGAVLGRVDGRMRGETVAYAGALPVSIAADARRLAVLDDAGMVEIRMNDGALVQTIPVGPARALALRAQRLFVVTDRGTLDVFHATTGERLASWPLPAGVEPRLDVHFGVAMVTAGGRVYAISVEGGGRALVARAPGPVRAQIEAPGIAYAYNESGKGFVRYVPFARIERLLGISGA